MNVSTDGASFMWYNQGRKFVLSCKIFNEGRMESKLFNFIGLNLSHYH